MNPKERGRRRFLKEGAALAGLAVGAIRSASGQTLGSAIPEVSPKDLTLYGERSRFENSARTVWSVAVVRSLGAASSRLFTPLQDSVGIITPSALHFVVGYPPRTSPPGSIVS